MRISRLVPIVLVLLAIGGAAQAQPTNDACDDAILATCGQTVPGTTTGSTFDDVGTCGTSNTSGGVWYSVIGTGSVITVSTCNQASYDTKLSVFTGDCGALTCVGGADDAAGCGGFTSEFSFPSVAGQEYRVLVHGFDTATGDFNLSVSCAAPPTGNDACDGADSIDCGQEVSGNTSSATFDGAPFCGTSNTAPGVWYEWVGDGSGVTLSTAGSGYDTKLTVYRDGCDVLECVDGNDDSGGTLQSEVSFLSEAGATYQILVHGFGSSAGDYILTMSCAGAPDNDDACAAEPAFIGVPVPYDNTFASAQEGEVSPGPRIDTGRHLHLAGRLVLLRDGSAELRLVQLRSARVGLRFDRSVRIG